MLPYSEILMTRWVELWLPCGQCLRIIVGSLRLRVREKALDGNGRTEGIKRFLTLLENMAAIICQYIA